jgi:hypothetical protein
MRGAMNTLNTLLSGQQATPPDPERTIITGSGGLESGAVADHERQPDVGGFRVAGFARSPRPYGLEPLLLFAEYLGDLSGDGAAG